MCPVPLWSGPGRGDPKRPEHGQAHQDVPPGLAQFEGFHTASYHEMMAVAVVGMLPMIVIFLVFHRAFIRGLTLAGLKE